MDARPLFSILHPSARPDKWRAVYDDWMSKCADPSQVEYVLCVDERWGFDPGTTMPGGPRAKLFGGQMVIHNHGRRCYVDAVNTAARAATGQVLIVIADDQFACEKWDGQIRSTLGMIRCGCGPKSPDWVIEVSTGSGLNGVPEHDRGIFVMPIVSRARYKRLGYLFYPEYESMFADNDLCEHARRDGVVIDARHLMFPHRHPMFDKSVPMDEQYKAQNRPEAYRTGQLIYSARLENHFQAVPQDVLAVIRRDVPIQSPAQPVQQSAGSQGKKSIAICFPGETFSSLWVEKFLALSFHIANKYSPTFYPCYTSNVYQTRTELARMILAEETKPDFVLWIDDDNLATPEQFDMLMADLDEHQDVDVMAAWCWIHFTQKQQFWPSCGNWVDGWKQFWLDPREWPKETTVRKIDWTGFPFVLMRTKALVKAGGHEAFLPIVDPKFTFGMMGEDLGWCKRAGEAGVILAADPRVRVDHLKLVSAEPFLAVAESAPEVKPKRNAEPRIAAMLRVKNEARWIKRVIEAILPLCDAGVFVMDDGSTDETRGICERKGAHVMGNPFDGSLDEARDKNHLLAHIVKYANPDWIICIDGDEELEEGGAEKIRAALRDTQMDSFTLNVPYLWDSPSQIRVDGIYRDVKRHSIFRPLPGLKFQSLYAGAANPVHTGLHTGNVPVWVRNPEKTGVLDVNLWHYGYMLKQDRLRKFEWYNQIDPNNSIENCYRHIVQGDIAGVPPSEVWKNAETGRVLAGPLELEPLTNGPRGQILNFTVLPTFPCLAERVQIINALIPSRLKLNLGCSDHLEPGFVNVDICEPADQIADLRIEWPWSDSSIAEIRAYDIIEHLPGAIHTMNEAFRVLKPGGRLDIIVPTTDGRGAFQDPTHVSFWNRNSFFYFEAGNPHLHRFDKAYGMKCAFRVVSEREETLIDGVKKLHIILEAVKEEVRMNAAD